MPVSRFPTTPARSRRSFTDLTRKASSDKSPREDRCDKLLSVMNQAVSEQRRRDEAPVRLANLKVSVASGASAPDRVLAQPWDRSFVGHQNENLKS
jgi:hypothetical protein